MNLLFFFLLFYSSMTICGTRWGDPINIELGEWAPNAVKKIGRDNFDTRDKWTTTEEKRTNTPLNLRTFPRCLNELRTKMLPRDRPIPETTVPTTTTEEPWPECGVKKSMSEAAKTKLSKKFSEWKPGYIWNKDPLSYIDAYYYAGTSFSWKIKNWGLRAAEIDKECYHAAAPTKRKSLQIDGCFECPDPELAKNAKVLKAYFWIFFKCFRWDTGLHATWYDVPALIWAGMVNIHSLPSQGGSFNYKFDFATIINNSPLNGMDQLTMFECYMCKDTNNDWTFYPYKTSLQHTMFLTVEHTCAPGTHPKYQVIRLDGINWNNDEGTVTYNEKRIVLCTGPSDKKCYNSEVEWVKEMFNYDIDHKNWFQRRQDYGAYVVYRWENNFFFNYHNGDETAQKFGYLMSEVHDNKKVNS